MNMKTKEGSKQDNTSKSSGVGVEQSNINSNPIDTIKVTTLGDQDGCFIKLDKNTDQVNAYLNGSDSHSRCLSMRSMGISPRARTRKQLTGKQILCKRPRANAQNRVPGRQKRGAKVEEAD